MGGFVYQCVCWVRGASALGRRVEGGAIITGYLKLRGILSMVSYGTLIESQDLKDKIDRQSTL